MNKERKSFMFWRTLWVLVPGTLAALIIALFSVKVAIGAWIVFILMAFIVTHPLPERNREPKPRDPGLQEYLDKIPPSTQNKNAL